MTYILSFVAGCLFTVLLGWVTYSCVRSLLDYREGGAVRRQLLAKEIRGKAAPVPDGDVIRPKTLRQLEDEKDETLKAFNDLMS